MRAEKATQSLRACEEGEAPGTISPLTWSPVGSEGWWTRGSWARGASRQLQQHPAWRSEALPTPLQRLKPQPGLGLRCPVGRDPGKGQAGTPLCLQHPAYGGPESRPWPPSACCWSQVATDLGDSAGSSTRWIERRERQGQARAINYLGRVGPGGGWPGVEERVSARKEIWRWRSREGAGVRGTVSVRVCQSGCWLRLLSVALTA